MKEGASPRYSPDPYLLPVYHCYPGSSILSRPMKNRLLLLHRSSRRGRLCKDFSAMYNTKHTTNEACHSTTFRIKSDPIVYNSLSNLSKPPKRDNFEKFEFQEREKMEKMDVEDVKMNEEEEEEQTLSVEVKEMLSDAKNMDNKEEALKKLDEISQFDDKNYDQVKKWKGVSFVRKGILLAKMGRTDQVLQLLKNEKSREFLESIPKARTAKIVEI